MLLTFGLERSVRLSDHEIVSQHKLKSRRIMLRFDLVPGIFKSEDLALVAFLHSLPKGARNDACADCNQETDALGKSNFETLLIRSPYLAIVNSATRNMAACAGILRPRPNGDKIVGNALSKWES